MERIAITIVGPTASGKTSLSLKVASKLNAEIISADSRQIYKKLTIGTAKPELEELQLVKHHFIDELDPSIHFNISKFELEGLEKIEKLFEEKKVPVIVGGSGLYIRAIVDGIFNDVDTDEEYRKELKKIKDNDGNATLYKLLEEKDPKAAAAMLPQNWKRVMRALEVFKLTGKSIKDFHQEYKRETDIEFLQFGLNWNREILYQMIENRVDQMIETGLVDEVKSILDAGYSKEFNSLNTVGYKEIIEFLENKITLERAIELIKRNTRRFAKRQMTWFRRDDRIKWFDINSAEDIESISDKIVSIYKSK